MSFDDCPVNMNEHEQPLATAHLVTAGYQEYGSNKRKK